MDRDEALRTKPRLDLILCETIAEPATTDGGIVMPEQSKGRPKLARVVRMPEPSVFRRKVRHRPDCRAPRWARAGSCGCRPERVMFEYQPRNVEVGDVVSFVGIEVELHDPQSEGRGGEVILVREEHIVAVHA
jgi:co-chaperonin GroES (HSP10)